MCRFAWLGVVAYVVCSGAVGRGAEPVCALLDPEKHPRVPLLEAKLLADSSATWVERGNIDKVLKEQKLQALFSPAGVGERVKLGKLLKADLLVMVRPVKGTAEPALEVVASETASGLRLMRRAVLLTKDADADVAALLAAVREGIGRHGEKVSEVVAVPPFVSNDLEYSHEYLKGAFGKLAEAEALGRKGVLVVELEEAQALAREVALAAPGSKVERPLPVYLLGEYRHEGKGKDRTLALKMRAERGGKPVGRAMEVTVAPADGPAEVRKWAAATLDALTKAPQPSSPTDPKAEAKLLAERSRLFAQYAYWGEALALAEASLLLDPDQTELYADALRALSPALGKATGEAYFAQDAEQAAVAARLFGRALVLVEEYCTRGGKDRFTIGISGPRELGIDRQTSPAFREEILKMRELRREVYLRIALVLAKEGTAKEMFYVWRALEFVPPRERYELVEKLVAQTEKYTGPRGRAVMYPSLFGHAPSDTPELQAMLARWAASDKKYLNGAAEDLRKKVADAKKFTLPLYATEPNPGNANAPGPDAVKFSPLRIEFESRGGRAVTPVVGVLALDARTDLFWTADALYLMTEKGKALLIWSTPAAKDAFGGGFTSVSSDGRYVWVAYGLLLKPPILLVVDPATAKVWDVSGAEGLPEPPPAPPPVGGQRFGVTPRVLAAGVEPGRAVLAGSFEQRAWLGVAIFDPKAGKVSVKVKLEARDVHDLNDPEQWKKTTVAFVPAMAFTVADPSGPDGKPSRRVLVGRTGGGTNVVVWDHPLIFDPNAGTVEVLKDRVWGWPHQGGCVASGGAVYFIEPMLNQARTRHVVRLGLPGPAKGIIVEGLPPCEGTRIAAHAGRFHMALEQIRQKPADKGPFTPTNPFMIRESQWWSVDLDGKNLRQVATRLPPINLVSASTHYGLVAVVEPAPGKPAVLNAVEIAEPKK